MTLHLSFPLCTSQAIKVPFQNKVVGLAHQSLASLCHSFFPFLSFSLCSSFRMTTWNTGLSEFTFLPGLLRPDWGGTLRVHQGEGVLCPHPTERVPAASVNRASSESGALITFCVNQGRSSLFSPLLLSLLAYAILLRESLDPTGAGPQ